MKFGVVLQLLIFLFLFRGSHLYSQDIVNEQDDYDTTGMIEKMNPLDMFNMFREQSYILLGSGFGNLDPLIFEGDIIPYFMISLSQDARWGIEISPRIIIRMFNKYSHPVQTPSYIPKATFFYQFHGGDRRSRNYFTFLSWMHHSNGQDGYFYNTDSTTINNVSGSFSTFWVQGGVFLAQKNNVLKFNTNFIKISADYNYKQERELKGIYGHLRFFVNIKSTVNLSDAFKTIGSSTKSNRRYVFDQSVKMGWIADELNNAKIIDKRRLIINYTLSFKPAFLRDLNLFVPYYYGQDYYNINFEHQISAIRFGIASKSSILF